MRHNVLSPSHSHSLSLPLCLSPPPNSLPLSHAYSFSLPLYLSLSLVLFSSSCLEFFLLFFVLFIMKLCSKPNFSFLSYLSLSFSLSLFRFTTLFPKFIPLSLIRFFKKKSFFKNLYILFRYT